MGMVLEIWQKDQFLYAKIPVKDFDTKDLQGMILEAESAKVSSGFSRPMPYTCPWSDKLQTRETTFARQKK